MLTGCRIINKNGKMLVRTAYNMSCRGLIVACVDVDYLFDISGRIKITAALKKVSPLPAMLPRFGVHIELPTSFESIAYYGRGEDENYSDFKEHTQVGIFETTVSKMGHKYIKPQDSGNRGDVRWVVMSDGNNAMKFAACDDCFNFNSNHFTLGQLKKAAHIEDIHDRDTSFTAIDGFVRGTGSASCGPAPSGDDIIKFGYISPLRFSFIVIPDKR